MDKSEFLSWTSPPCPIQPLVNKVVATFSDIPWHQNDQISISKNLKNIIDSCESSKTNKYQYPQDLRLKFYQILQSNTHRNPDVVLNTINHRRPSLDDAAITTENERSLIPAILKQNPLIQCNDLLKRSQDSYNSQTKFFENYGPSYIDSNVNISCARNYRNGKSDIKKLFILVEKQSQLIESLKLQINTLLGNLSKFGDNVTKTSSQRIDNAIRSFESIKFQQTPKDDTEPKAISIGNKVSIGVMTSFELTIQNIDVAIAKNHMSSEEMYEVIESHSETFHALKSPTENIIEKSEGQFSERTDRGMIDSYQEVKNWPIDKASYSMDDDVNGCANAPAKVGWTFYNNVLCHVNEILHNSDEIQACHTSCDTLRKSKIQSAKALGAVITDITNVITSNTNDKRITFDSSYYPHVKYQNNIIYSSNSMADNNASIHMRALALKYLGDKYSAWDHSSTFQEATDELSKSRSISNHMLHNTISLSRNHMNNHELIGNESSIVVNNSNVQKQNILDISILKRQPKLL